MRFVYTQHVVFYLRRRPQAWLQYTFSPEKADSLSSKLFPLLFILAENYFFFFFCWTLLDNVGWSSVQKDYTFLDKNYTYTSKWREGKTMRQKWHGKCSFPLLSKEGGPCPYCLPGAVSLCLIWPWPREMPAGVGQKPASEHVDNQAWHQSGLNLYFPWPYLVY